MRMWMVDPRLMCDRHLLGEHVELHMIVGCVNHGKSLKGYLEKRIIDPSSVYFRHKELVSEMTSRGMNHKSHMGEYDDLILFHGVKPYVNRIDKEGSLDELHKRCINCRNKHGQNV